MSNDAVSGEPVPGTATFEVWVVLQVEDYHGSEILAVFASEAAANRYAAEWVQPWPTSSVEVERWPVQ